MKKVLITGANSYIGTSFERYVELQQLDIEVSTLDLLNPKWEAFDFSSFDSIFHVAAIVHKNEKTVDPNLYYSVNRDLPFRLANLAKKQGVKQFIFLSSMSVYGDSDKKITQTTLENPTTYYGKSKLEAEGFLKELDSESFQIAILRPPMVYGPRATGNYSRLSKLSKILPIFPKIDNERSMIFIDNLSNFVFKIIELELDGTFFPQNKDYICTSELFRCIRKENGKDTILISFLNPLLSKCLSISPIEKLFGNLIYSKEISEYGFEYQLIDFKQSIRLSEK